jgi:hypothetical protein
LSPPIMELPDYVQSLSFRLAPPDRSTSKGLYAAAALLTRLGVPLDVVNTRLPRDGRETRLRLREARRACPRGNFALGAIVNRAVSQMSETEAFVALGLGDGFSLLAAIAGNPDKPCIGVDPPGEARDALGKPACRQFDRKFESLRSATHVVHRLEFEDFFSGFGPLTGRGETPIGVCLIRAGSDEDSADDLHERLVLSESHLAENANVLIENVNAAGVREAALGFIRESRNQYRVLLDQPTPRPGRLTFGDGLFLYQLLGRNQAADRRARKPIAPALVPAA